MPYKELILDRIRRQRQREKGVVYENDCSDNHWIRRIKNLYPDEIEILLSYCDLEGQQKEDILNELLETTSKYFAVKETAELLVNKNDLLHEARDNQYRLKKLSIDLLHLSPGILNDDRKVVELIFLMREIAKEFGKAAIDISNRDRKRKPNEIIRDYARSLTVDALGILSRYKIPISASGTAIGENAVLYTSSAVEILVILHKLVSFPHHRLTIRDQIASVKKKELAYLFDDIASISE